jgi:hypothetical protein
MAVVNVVIKGRIFPYELSGPYIFKSGKKVGQSVEALMFADRGYLAYLKNIADKEMAPGSLPNRLHLHLAWVMRAGEFIKSPQECHYCSSNTEYKKIEFFSVRYSSGGCSYNHQFACCSQEECKQKIWEEKSKLFPLKFSSLAYFSNAEQKRLGIFFKDLFLGPGRLDTKKAFELFSSANQL